MVHLKTKHTKRHLRNWFRTKMIEFHGKSPSKKNTNAAIRKRRKTFLKAPQDTIITKNNFYRNHLFKEFPVPKITGANAVRNNIPFQPATHSIYSTINLYVQKELPKKIGPSSTRGTNWLKVSVQSTTQSPSISSLHGDSHNIRDWSFELTLVTTWFQDRWLARHSH